MARRESVPDVVPGGAWVSFAALMVMLSGAFTIILGISAISGADQLVNNLLFANLEAWGWVFVVWGAVEILAGLAIMRGATWGILAGILFAFVGCVMHLTFATAHPIFSLTIVAVDVLVIYGLTVYGFEHRDPLR
jgi:hypothetical protein